MESYFCLLSLEGSDNSPIINRLYSTAHIVGCQLYNGGRENFSAN